MSRLTISTASALRLAAIAAISWPIISNAQTADQARLVAESYSRLMIAQNVDSVIDMTNHVLISELGGKQSARRWLTEQYQRLSGLDSQPVGEVIGRIREYHDNAIDLFFVDTVRSFDAFPKPSQSTYFYVIDTTDKGKSWEVLDLSCTNSTWLHAIAPSFHEYDKVRDLVRD